MKKVVIIISILLCISIGFNIYFGIKATTIKSNILKELSMQTLDVRLDTNLTSTQISETIRNIQNIQYINKVENRGLGIVFVELTDINKYEEVKDEILKIDGVNNIVE
ncbi:MAG: hypothetical protein U0L98_04690 [Clostridia bacterium]|nr:hypothetical protein [Clostridia bacterium]